MSPTLKNGSILLIWTNKNTLEYLFFPYPISSIWHETNMFKFKAYLLNLTQLKKQGK